MRCWRKIQRIIEMMERTGLEKKYDLYTIYIESRALLQLIISQKNEMGRACSTPAGR